MVSVPVSGTPYSLKHFTNRAPGHTEDATVEIPLIVNDPPPQLEGVHLDIEVAGQIVERVFGPVDDLSFEYQWDGKDAYGRPLLGSYSLDFTVGYEYPLVRVPPRARPKPERTVFNESPGEGPTFATVDSAYGGDPTGQTATITRSFNGDAYKVMVTRLDPRVNGLGGWHLDVHHDYDPGTGVLRRGDGRRRDLPPETEGPENVIDMVAGIPPDGQLSNPKGCDVGPDKSVYVADPGVGGVRRRLQDGTVETVVGTLYDVDPYLTGEDARTTRFPGIQDVAVNSVEEIAIPVIRNQESRVFRIDEQGVVQQLPALPDPNPETDSPTMYPKAVAYGPNDELYVVRSVDVGVDGDNNVGRSSPFDTDRIQSVVHRIDPDDSVELVAGTGEGAFEFEDYQFDQEPLQATEATLGNVTGIDVDEDGRLYLGDSGFNVVFRVDEDGTIRVIAGTGTAGYDGDGGPATDAALDTEYNDAGGMDVAVDGFGGVLLSDDEHGVVRRVDGTGVIQTVAGTGERGYTGNGDDPEEATFIEPTGLCSDGGLGYFVVDDRASALRHVYTHRETTTSGATLEARRVDYRMGTTQSMAERGSADRPGLLTATGDGGPAMQASLGRPYDLAVGPDDEVYVSSPGTHTVRKVDPDESTHWRLQDGTITTVAGTGSAGYSGNGGDAARARLNDPRGIEVGSDGALYVADSGNNAVRKVRPDGTITTVYDGFAIRPVAITIDEDDSIYVGVDDGEGEAYVARIGRDGSPSMAIKDGEVVDIGVEGIGLHTDGVPTEDLSLETGIEDIAYDGEDGLYVLQPNRVLHAELTGQATLLAGRIDPVSSRGDSGVKWVDGVELSPTGGLTLGDNGNIYVTRATSANQATYRIFEVTMDGTVTSLDRDEPGTHVTFDEPKGIVENRDRDLLIADHANHAVRRIPQGRSKYDDEHLIPSVEGDRVFVFSEGGRHLRTHDALTGDELYSFEYIDGDLTKIVDFDGNETTVEYDADGIAIVSRDGLRTELSLDDEGYVESVTNPANEENSFEYEGGQVTSATDATDETTELAYTDTGLIEGLTDPLDNSMSLSQSESRGINTETLQYDAERTLTLDTAGGRTDTFSLGVEGGDPKLSNGNTDTTTVMKADSVEIDTPDSGSSTASVKPDPRFGLRAPVPSDIENTTPSGRTRHITSRRSVSLANRFDPLSVDRQVNTLSVNGRVKEERYDADAETLTTTYPSGRTITQKVGTAGRVLETDVSGRERTEYEYDDAGRLTTSRRTTGAESREWIISYDDNGFYEEITDPRGQSRTFDVDAVGRPTGLTHPDGVTVGFAYDEAGRMTQLTLPSGSAHDITYDAADNLTGYSPPGTDDEWTYTYDGDGYLTRLELPSGTVVANSVDDEGRLQTISLPRGTVTRTYDQDTDNLMSIEGPDGSTLSFSYDGPLTTEEELRGPVSGTVSRTYDDSFRLSKLTVDGAWSVFYDYDDDNQLVAAGNCSITRDDAGLVESAEVYDVTRTWERNGFGEIASYNASADGSLLYDVTYGRNEQGSITELTETVDGSTTTREFEYDERHRLTEVREDDQTIERYEYDGNGNRTTVERGGETISPSYDERDRLETAGDREYSYDDDGRLESKTDTAGETTFDYGARGSLLGVSLPDGTEVEYEVDPNGRRVGKRVDGTLQRGWLYRNGMTPVAELDGDGNVVTQFVYATSSGTPDYMIRDGTPYVFVWDHVGSPRLVVNAQTGDVAQRMEYDAWGRVVEDTNPGFQPFGFAGGLYDPDTGLVRFGMRDYDPEMGQFTAADPIGFDGSGSNLYAYAGNDPVNRTDRSGLLAITTSIGVGILVGATLDAGLDAGAQYVQHGEVRDWGSVGKSAVIGGVTGALGAGAKAGYFATMVAEAAINAAGAAIGKLISNYRDDCASLGDGMFSTMALAGGLGSLGGAAGKHLDNVADSLPTMSPARKAAYDNLAASNPGFTPVTTSSPQRAAVELGRDVGVPATTKTSGKVVGSHMNSGDSGGDGNGAGIDPFGGSF